MKAIVQTAPGELVWREQPRPDPGPGQVRIRTRACGICATDLVMIDGWNRTGVPAVPGHEWTGRVDAVGSGVDEALRGVGCVGENVLRDGGEVGFEHPGGYGEYFLTEAETILRLPETMDPAAATLVEPLAVCLRGLSRMGPAGKGATLVLGDGPVGLLMTGLLARKGAAPLLLVGGREARLALGRDLGATVVLEYRAAGDDLPAAVRHECPAWDRVVEASGSPRALKTALACLAPGGTLLLLGDYGEARARFRWNRLLLGEWTVVGSNASAGAWDEAVRLAGEEALPLARLVSHRFPAREYAEALRCVRTSRDAVKVVLDWEVS